jgi:hypothetical protein
MAQQYFVAPQQKSVRLRIIQEERSATMLFSSLIAHIKDRLAKRAEFNRMLSQINSFSNEDLSDMRASRAEMIHQAYRQVYGEAK